MAPTRDDSAAPVRRIGAADIVLSLPHQTQERASTTVATKGRSTSGKKAMKIAFGSCHKTKYADAQIWKTIAAEEPEAFLWTGDAVYPPVRNIASLEQLEQEYQRTLSDPSVGYDQFVARLGNRSTGGGGVVFGTWDDHDYGGNDRGNDMPQKRERAELFYRFLGDNKIPPSVAKDREGVYYSVEWMEKNDADYFYGDDDDQNGDSNNKKENRRRSVKTIFLDTRWFRQAHCLPSVAGKFPLGAGVACLSRWLSAGLFPDYCTRQLPEHALLGAAQWEWLEAQMQEEVPSVLIVVSSIQVLTTNPVVESWGHFEAERNRLVQLLLRAQQRGSHVVLLSGDVHHGEILDPFASSSSSSSSGASSASGSAFLEVTSSGLTHDCSAHIYGALCKPLLEAYAEHRYDKSKKNYYIGRNYGTVNIDWDRETVEVAVHEVVNGTIVLTTGARPMKILHSLPAEFDASLNNVLPCMDGHLWAAFLTLALLAVGGRILLVRRNRDEK